MWYLRVELPNFFQLEKVFGNGWYQYSNCSECYLIVNPNSLPHLLSAMWLSKAECRSRHLWSWKLVPPELNLEDHRFTVHFELWYCHFALCLDYTVISLTTFRPNVFVAKSNSMGKNHFWSAPKLLRTIVPMSWMKNKE